MDYYYENPSEWYGTKHNTMNTTESSKSYGIFSQGNDGEDAEENARPHYCDSTRELRPQRKVSPLFIICHSCFSVEPQ